MMDVAPAKTSVMCRRALVARPVLGGALIAGANQHTATGSRRPILSRSSPLDSSNRGLTLLLGPTYTEIPAPGRLWPAWAAGRRAAGGSIGAPDPRHHRR